jgi:signal peptidase II
MNILKKIDKKNFSFINQKNNLICFLMIILIFVFDRISKIKIINHQINNNRVYINDFINLDLVWNTGIGFGLLSFNSDLIYNLITAIIGVIMIFLIYLILKSNFLDKTLFSLVMGGALGNFYDRLVYFAVPDFIDIHYQNFHWFTFNIADIFITIGIIMLISKDLFLKNGEDL